MRKIRHNSGMRAYLESVGLLNNGTEEQIKKAKKDYWRKYFQEFKRKQRLSKSEFTVILSKENGEHETIVSKAKEHQMSVPLFIKESAFAYIHKTYLPPYWGQIANLEQLLSECLFEIQNIAKQKERFFWDHEQKYKNIENRIEKIEKEIIQALTNPFTIEELVKKAMEKNPSLGQNIINVISQYHDRQSKVA